mmetsp:Transcript_28916/g.39719  ORF Transcript_28916/g.39719 Transcript_28916/m.39719 type:complete len:625 (+) Transcript_28916:169-2043(+)
MIFYFFLHLYCILITRETCLALICVFGGYCSDSSDCVAGTKCDFSNPYYSQCVHDDKYSSKYVCLDDNFKCGGVGFTDPRSCCNGNCVKFNDYYSMCVALVPPHCVSNGNFVGLTSTVSPSRTPSRKPSPRSVELPLICQFGGYCERSSDCYAGNFCSFGSYPYYTQCLPDPSTYRSSNCLSNYGAGLCYSSSQCCDPGAYCDSNTRQCHQPSINSGDCRNPLNFAKPSNPPTTVPTVVTSFANKAPTLIPTKRRPSVVPTSVVTISPTTNPTPTSTTRSPSKVPSRIPSKTPSKVPSWIPSKTPSKIPTRLPSKPPSKKPSHRPSRRPTAVPSESPTNSPSESPSLLIPILYPTEPPTMEPSLSPPLAPLWLRVNISQSSGTSVAVAELEFYRRGVRVDPSLFDFKATSDFGTPIGPVTDLVLDTYGVPALANDGNLHTAFRSHFPTDFYPDPHPRLFVTTGANNTFDEIRVYNRRNHDVWHYLFGAVITVEYTGRVNKLLWSATLNDSKPLYTFSQVNSGTLGNLSALSPTPTPTNIPTLTPNPAANIVHLVVTLDQSNTLYYLECAEIQLFVTADPNSLIIDQRLITVTETSVFGEFTSNDDSFGISTHGRIFVVKCRICE